MQVVMSLRGVHNGSRARGIGVYLRELLAAFVKYTPDLHVTPTSRDYTNLQPDVVHFPAFDPFYISLPFSSKVPTVLTIHDLTPLKFPSHFPKGLRGELKWQIQKRLVKRMDRIITDSVCSQVDIHTMLGIPKEKITVIPLGPSVSEKVPVALAKKIAAKYNLPNKYLLYVGDINWNKNIPGLIDGFSKLKDNKLHLVLVGKPFSDRPHIPEYKAIQKAIAASGKEANIHLIGFVPTHQLPIFYTRALLYVQPSWYEGFGLPVLEAMHYGCPVACSDRGSLPEIGGNAVTYFDPAKNMSETINHLLRAPRTRVMLRERGRERAKLFTWEKAARATYDVYKQLCHQA